MIVPDANLLLYAYSVESPFHAASKVWWTDCLSGDEPVGIPPQTLFAFVRIVTNIHLFQRPLSIREAAEHVETWRERACVQFPEFESRDSERALEFLLDLGTAGNLTTDAQIAAIAIRLDAIVHTADTDFGRFRGVRWHNPLLVRKK